MIQTNAYEEITSGICPLVDDLQRVTSLLESLAKNGRITRSQYKQMQPDIHKLELAHLYFIPKAHKVKKTRITISYYLRLLFVYSSIA